MTVKISSLAGLGLLITGGLLLSACSPEPAPAPTVTATKTVTPTPSPTPTPTPTYNIDDPASLTVVSNKRRPLNPVSYEPADLVMTSVISNPNGRLLRAEVAAQVDRLAADASAASIFLTVLSGYRSYATQEQTYNNFVARDGEERANQYSAKPGHSEHQTGLAVDFDDGQGCALYNCFADTAAGQWLAANAWQYGFILRYQLGSEHITGYEFEPWHYRYVGTEVSTAMHNNGIATLEEFFGLEPAPTY